MINFFASTLFGIMIAFMALVSPVVFSTLTKESSQAFLRKFFPRLFVLGAFISSILVAMTLQEIDIKNQVFSIIIFFGFLLNLFVITPSVNKYRDLELQGDNKAKKLFSLLHLSSVCIFFAQLILILLLIFL